MLNIVKKIKKEFFSHKLIYLLLGITIIGALFFRLYRTGAILSFYYDQGRDALVIWDLIRSNKFFLIGPTTGLPGIFRGPYYYYLIAPFYWIGKGNPVWPADFLAITSVGAIVYLFILGAKIQDKFAGLFTAIIASFSLNIIGASRWLSNPTPMLILSLFLVWAMIKVTEGKRWGWPVIALVSGLSLFNFGSSGEFFYFPALFIFLVWQWKNRPDLKNLILSIFLFVATFAPLVLFDVKHSHILLNNFLGTFGMGGGSFRLPTLDFIKTRSALYWDIFTNKIFQTRNTPENLALIIISISFLVFLPKLFKNTGVKVLLLLLVSATLGLYFYQGNYGILYDYYMTGYYLIFILLFGIVLGNIWKYKFGKVFVIYFFTIFFMNNLPVAWSRINDNCDGPKTICLKNQEEAIGWIYKDADGHDFNVDEYVPPVIPYAYNYLFTWLGTEKYHKMPTDNQISLLYTLYEVDPPHPERLDAWLLRQKGIGKMESEASFGGITVQRRLRISNGK